MEKKLAVAFCLLFYGITHAQEIRGVVLEENTAGKTSPVVGALVGVKGTNTATLTSDSGTFVIAARANDTLIISSTGYKPDTLALKSETFVRAYLDNLELGEVEIKARKASRLEMSARNVEVINSSDLVKDACCNLSESFDNSATVDVNFTDAVSGAKEIRMLGLDGKYTQVMTENVPAIVSLGNTFGMGYIPGPWMSSIQLNKGAGSVVNGYQSITGQINVELKKPLEADRLFVNLYLNQDLRSELNVMSGTRINDHWSMMNAIHGQYSALRIDMNKDKYLDNPLVRNLNLFNRFTYMSGKVFSFISAVTLNMEDRRGGAVKFDPREDLFAQSAWGLRLKTTRLDASFKTGFNLPNENHIGVQYKYIFQQQAGYIGRRNYDGGENYGYLNFIYQKNLDEREDMIKLGASFLVDAVNEQLDTLLRRRTELVPGIFSEASFNLGKQKQVVLVTGMRLDRHNLYGIFASPRVNVKWNIIPTLSLRVGGGKGYRVPTIFAENFGLLASSREISLAPGIAYEEAWNYGASLTYKFELGFREGLISVDYYRTDFIHQLVADLENPRRLNFYMVDARSYANAAQAEISYELVKGLDAKLAYKYEQAINGYNGGKNIVPLRPRNRGLVSLQYTTKNKHWRFNSSLNWFGKTRIPSTTTNDSENQRPLSSKDFFQWNAQITYKWRAWEVYVGGENLLNFSQKNPIIAGDQPFSNQFDATLIWGPLRGAMAFTGVRFTIK